MKIKLFVTYEIQYFELGIFSFNSYVYYLSRGFIASTYAFNLPTRAFNHATRALSLLTRGFELVTFFFLFIRTYISTNYTKLKEIKIYIYKYIQNYTHTKSNPYCSSQQIRYIKHWYRRWKKNFQFLIPVKMHQKDISQETSDSSNLLLSLMKRIEDVIILKFISLEKLFLPNNKACTISISLIFRISELIELRSSKRAFRWFEKLNKKLIGVFCFKGTRAQWVQCILKIMFKFMFSEMAETNTKTCQ